jgi:hypothetical protein
MTLPKNARRIQAQIALHERWHSDRPELADAARRELKTLSLAEHLAKVNEWPPLTDEQRERLAELLLPSVG